MATIIIRSNLDTAALILVPDLGILIPPAGGNETFTDAVNISDVQGSEDIRTLTSDSAFVGGTDPSDHTLILNDGTQDIAPDEVEYFLNPSSTAGTPTYVRTYTAGVLLRDVVYQKTDGTVDRADATVVATGIPVGLVEQIDFPAVNKCVVRYAGDLEGFTGLVAGEVYILSTSPGLIVRETNTGHADYPDTTPDSGHVIAEVGMAASATKLFVGTIRDFEEM